MNLHPVVRLLRIDTASAAQVEGSSYVGPTMIPVGAWIVMAWNRFGSQGVFAPAHRFVSS